jgi:hypothetical protein
VDARIDELSTRLRDADLAEADRSRLTEELARSGGERTALRRQMEQE